MSDLPANDELKLTISETILHTSGLIKKYGNPIIHPPELNKELDKVFDNAVAQLEAYCTRRMEQTVNEISKQLPWPKDIFGEVGYDDWPKIHEFATKELGYPIDRISGTLMRVGWLNFERMIKDRIKELEGANGGDD